MATFYVDAAVGSDANDGSSASPFLTIAKGTAASAVGDTIRVRAGTYNETVVPKSQQTYIRDSASHARPIIHGGGVRTTGVVISPEGAKWIRIEGFEITGQTAYGVSMQTVRGYNTANIIHDNEIHHINGPPSMLIGIRAGFGNPIITNNLIHHIGHGFESYGIWLASCDDAIVEGNEVCFMRKTGIRLWQCLRCVVRSNRVYANWSGMDIQDSIGSLIANNYSHHNQAGIYVKHSNQGSSLQAWGIQLSAVGVSVPYERIYHNTIYAARWGLLTIATNTPTLTKAEWKNNICVASGGDAYIHDAPWARTTDVAVDYNCYDPSASPNVRNFWHTGFTNPVPAAAAKTFAQMRTDLGWETHGAELAPGLNDPEAGDLDYQSSSPVIGMGADLGVGWGAQMGARGLPPPRFGWTRAVATGVSASGTLNLTAIFDNQAGGGPSSTSTLKTGTSFAIGDFGSVKPIDHFYQDPHAHGSGNNLRELRFETSLDGVTWDLAWEGLNRDNSQATTWHEIIGGQRDARYVQLTLIDSFGGSAVATAGICAGLLGIAEVEPPPPGAPVNTVVPVIAGATAEGSTLTVTSTGTWTNSPTSFTYQWQRGGVSIAGATASTYQSVPADVGLAVHCLVRAVNAGGTSSPAASNTITVTKDTPVNTVAPVIAGLAVEGSLLSVTSPGTWTNGPDPAGYTYQWQRATVNIVGATLVSYQSVLADVGSAVRCRVRATNVAGSSDPAASNEITVTAAPQPPVNTVLPDIDGVLLVGRTLTVSQGTWLNSPSVFAAQWTRDGVNITNATGWEYVTTVDDVNTDLECDVTATNNAASVVTTALAVTVSAASPPGDGSGRSRSLIARRAITI